MPANLYNSKRNSQTLIEVVLSIGLAAMVLSALLVLGAASSKTVASSLKRSQATKLAVESIEATRYLRDSKGFASLQNGCYRLDSTNITTVLNCDDANAFVQITLAVDSSANNYFYRKIEIVDGGNIFSKQINVTVRWEEATGENSGVGSTNYKSIDINTILSKW